MSSGADSTRVPMDDPAAPPRPGGRGNGPVYVGGLDRSGKTTMAAFLGSHSRISIPAVGSNMWTYFYRRFGDLSIEANLDACLDAMWHYKHVRFLQPDMAEIKRRFLGGPPTYAELFALVLRQYAEERGKARWGAQTGLIERYAPEMFAAYPGLQIVHMIRDPRDRYEASLALWPDGKGRAGGAVARWIYSEGLARRHERQWPHQYLVVRFEDLITAPEATLRRVCAFLDEEFEPAMMSMDASPRHRDRMAEAGPPGAILDPSYIGRHARLDRDEVAFIETRARRPMERRGYAVGPRPAPTWRFRLAVWPNQVVRMLAWRTVEELQQRFPRLVRREPGRRMLLERSR